MKRFLSIQFHVSLFFSNDRNKATFRCYTIALYQVLRNITPSVVNHAGTLLEYTFSETIKIIIDKKNGARLVERPSGQEQQEVTVMG